jgi:hypothetical protein
VIQICIPNFMNNNNRERRIKCLCRSTELVGDSYNWGFSLAAFEAFQRMMERKS